MSTLFWALMFVCGHSETTIQYDLRSEDACNRYIEASTSVASDCPQDTKAHYWCRPYRDFYENEEEPKEDRVNSDTTD